MPHTLRKTYIHHSKRTVLYANMTNFYGQHDPKKFLAYLYLKELNIKNV